MDYSNPEIPEGINVTKTHPLKEFTLLTAGVFGALFGIVLSLAFFADRLAHFIPYSVETNMPVTYISSTSNPQMTNYLQTLAVRIADAQKLPQEINLKIHYSNEDSVNAYATLGGNIVFFRGLLQKIPNENALAMVMAHEIAHIKHRHPIRSIGRGIVVGLVVSVFSSSLGTDIVNNSIGNTGYISQLQFTREHEIESDETALLAMQKLYGHVNGANDLFEVLKAESNSLYVPEFLSTHPAIDSRIKRTAEFNQNTPQKTDSALTMLPSEYHAWLETNIDSATN